MRTDPEALDRAGENVAPDSLWDGDPVRDLSQPLSNGFSTVAPEIHVDAVGRGFVLRACSMRACQMDVSIFRRLVAWPVEFGNDHRVVVPFPKFELKGSLIEASFTGQIIEWICEDNLQARLILNASIVRANTRVENGSLQLEENWFLPASVAGWNRCTCRQPIGFQAIGNDLLPAD
jgi:hypothetical protein